MKKGHILVVDDNKNVLTALRILLERHFETVTLLSSPNRLPETLRTSAPDVVLLDMNFSAALQTGNEGLYWLSEIKKYDAERPVILFTAYADIDLAVKALKLGASDFVVKPWDNATLVAALQTAYSLRESQKEVRRLRETQTVLQAELGKEQALCWGVSEEMHRLRTLVEKVAATDADILITGENGTGKEVVAREIHRLSLRRNEVLISVDLGAITESLFESELFGHVKGSFTDAKADRVGKFEAANGGTLFLDEVGNLSYPLQAKLLSALQSRQIVRVGSNRPLAIDIRLISATNRDLMASVRTGGFREDLLYRINTIPIELPPLRERREDIAGLADFFLQKQALKYRKGAMHLSPDAVRKLKEYAWPGNVRELQHTMEKAVILSDNVELQAADFYLQKSAAPDISAEMTLESAEHLLIQQALKRHPNNLSAAAAELGISRPTLYSKIRKYRM
jgi:DNA-binding NtrC family response regulator